VNASMAEKSLIFPGKTDTAAKFVQILTRRKPAAYNDGEYLYESHDGILSQHIIWYRFMGEVLAIHCFRPGKTPSHTKLVTMGRGTCELV